MTLEVALATVAQSPRCLGLLGCDPSLDRESE
jgi:hypothetical protein